MGPDSVTPVAELLPALDGVQPLDPVAIVVQLDLLPLVRQDRGRLLLSP
jgi:hypothetical protein